MRWLLRLSLNLAGRFLAWRERRNAFQDPPLSRWFNRDLPDAVPPAPLPDKRSPFRCSCGELAAADEVDLCHTCRRRADEVEAHVEERRRERNRKRREAAARKREKPRARLRLAAGGRG